MNKHLKDLGLQDANTREQSNETGKAKREDILFAIRWADGQKLFGVKHVKGSEWKTRSEH